MWVDGGLGEGETIANPRPEMEKLEKPTGEQRPTKHFIQNATSEGKGRMGVVRSLRPAKLPTGN